MQRIYEQYIRWPRSIGDIVPAKLAHKLAPAPMDSERWQFHMNSGDGIDLEFWIDSVCCGEECNLIFAGYIDNFILDVRFDSNAIVESDFRIYRQFSLVKRRLRCECVKTIFDILAKRVVSS